MLTERRNYIPILSLYFLSLPDSTAQQIGLYMGIGSIVGFLLEIPSGYLSDTIGHKFSLILAKVSLLRSTCFFVFGSSLIHFIFGSVFISTGFAFSSGTSSAFLHNTLTNLKREKEFGTLNGKIRSNVSLVSAFMILALPFLSSFSLIMPIKIYLVFDIFGLIIALFLHSPKMVFSADDIKGESILSQLKRFKGTGFYLISIFLGLISGFMFGLSGYKEPFVASLGMPIVLIGFIMASSRFFWFLFGNNLKFLKRIKIKTLLAIEIFLFPGMIVLSSLLKNPYIVGLVIVLLKGYFYARKSIFEEVVLNKFFVNKRYKATLLSVMSQISMLFQSIVAFFVGFIMVLSFSLGFFISGVVLFLVLIGLFPFVRKIFD
ncbi:MAG: hypothetical protein ACLFN8_00160 [Candidatus Woesearchaeota archaeon]